MNTFDDTPKETHQKVITLLYEDEDRNDAIAAALVLMAPRLSRVVYAVYKDYEVDPNERDRALADCEAVRRAYPAGVYFYGLNHWEEPLEHLAKDLDELPGGPKCRCVNGMFSLWDT